MGRLNKNGKYVVTFDEYDRIEENVLQIMEQDAGMPLYNTSLGDIPSVEELEEHEELIANLAESLPYLLLYYHYIPEYLKTCESETLRNLYSNTRSYIYRYLKEHLEIVE